MKDLGKMLPLLKKGRSDTELEMSADNPESVMTHFLQVVLAILIPFMMIAITHQERFNAYIEDAEKAVRDMRNKYKHLEGTTVKIEYDERIAKTEEVQWLKILKALAGVEKEARDSMYLNLFVQANGNNSVIRPDLKVLSGTQISNEYFRPSCNAAARMLPYGKYATREPVGLEQDWFQRTLKKASLELLRHDSGVEMNVTADNLDTNPDALTTANKGRLNRQIKQRVNSLYEDTCMLQSKALKRLEAHCRTNPVKGTKFFKTAEQLWKVSEEEQDGLRAKLLFELDEYTKSVLEKQGVELLPEVWQRNL